MSTKTVTKTQASPKKHTITLVVDDGYVKPQHPEDVWKGVKPGDLVQFVSPAGEVTVNFKRTKSSGQLPFDANTIRQGHFHKVLNVNDEWIGECSITAPDGKVYHYRVGDGIKPCYTC